MSITVRFLVPDVCQASCSEGGSGMEDGTNQVVAQIQIESKQRRFALATYTVTQQPYIKLKTNHKCTSLTALQVLFFL
ncbi:hypothetical protein EG68_05154 [Paragonimus skrjabini miyazakii]|uniref:Uncharacterized protein n=1 Tax=Paragonimus skrjabini miyazakii TaxID=59628 RepID=A0A8S9YRZ4_9TREM|nr:hypothetical protein EG68_05154 [Paragonimus skrjabini miyazakii]